MQTLLLLLLLLKVAQSQNVFHVGPNLQKGVPNHDPEQYPPTKKMIRVIIWHPFLEIWAKVKNFLRLSHLYCPSQCSTTYEWLTGSSGHHIFQSRWQPMTGLTAEFLDDWHSRPRHGGNALQWRRQYTAMKQRRVLRRRRRAMVIYPSTQSKIELVNEPKVSRPKVI